MLADAFYMFSLCSLPNLFFYIFHLHDTVLQVQGIFSPSLIPSSPLPPDLLLFFWFITVVQSLSNSYKINSVIKLYHDRYIWVGKDRKSSIMLYGYIYTCLKMEAFYSEDVYCIKSLLFQSPLYYLFLRVYVIILIIYIYLF